MLAEGITQVSLCACSSRGSAAGEQVQVQVAFDPVSCRRPRVVLDTPLFFAMMIFLMSKMHTVTLFTLANSPFIT